MLEDSTGAPIEGAEVASIGLDPTVKPTLLGTTDDRGMIYFAAPKDTKTIQITKPGFQRFKQDFASLKSSRDFNIFVRLVSIGDDRFSFPSPDKSDDVPPKLEWPK